MAAGSGIYFADDLSNPMIGSTDGTTITRGFIATPKTMLATTGATKFLQGDLILLAPIPVGALLFDYRVYVCPLDTSTGITLSLGDTQVLAAAVTGQTSGAQTTPTTLGTTFTLTAAASTSGFTATNGILNVGNNVFVSYSSLSGSTFLGCQASIAGYTWPSGTPIQQCGNTAAYQAAAVIGQSSAAGILRPDYNLTGTTFATTTVVQNALPANYPPGFNTTIPAIGAYPPTLGNIAPNFLSLYIATTTTTAFAYLATTQIVGSIVYDMKGLQP